MFDTLENSYATSLSLGIRVTVLRNPFAWDVNNKPIRLNERWQTFTGIRALNFAKMNLLHNTMELRVFRKANSKGVVVR